MKVLWFTNTSSGYDNSHPTFGGGWIASLEKMVKEVPEIDLGIGFFHASDSQKTSKNNVTYYPILQRQARKNPIRTVWNKWRGDIGNAHMDQLQLIIADFQPDLIHVFGTEGLFSSIQQYTTIPVVIHLQGLMNPIANAFFAPGFSAKEILFDRHFWKQNLLGNSLYFQFKRVQNQAKREQENLRMARYVMGRTAWDKQVSTYYQPDVHYFHADEVLREAFRKPVERTTQEQFILTSTISGTSYKGIDVILKTAELLTNQAVNFQWRLVGITENNPVYQFFQRKTGIEGKRVQVTCLGAKSPEELADILSSTSVFIHPSYIDNSPNSVCEAQLMGLPVIACDTGGVGSLIEHNVSGFLVPTNGIYEVYHHLIRLQQTQGLAQTIGEQAQTIARKRHDEMNIKKSVIEAYEYILNEQS